MKKNQKYKIFFSFLLFFLACSADFAKAQQLEIVYPRVPGATPPQEFANNPALQGKILSLYIQYFFNLVIWISGIIAICALIYGGILYLTSTGKAENTKKARDQISGAFLGILILLSSWLIFSVLSPSIANVNISVLPTTSPIAVPSVSPIPQDSFYSLIETQLPFGTIIENILQTQDPSTTIKSRMNRIKDIGQNSITLANKLKDNASKLKNASGGCKCQNSTPRCDPDSCTPIGDGSCTCDVCSSARSEIQSAQKSDLEIMSSASDNISKEQNNANQEIRSLNEELGKLNQLVVFIKKCPLSSIASLAKLLADKDAINQSQWYLRENNFWKGITIDENQEWATFYCPVSGTTNPQSTPQATNQPLLPEEASGANPVGCTTEIPVGEIIDQVQRIVAKITERLQKIIDTDAKLMDAVDKLHTYVSQCTSQAPKCHSICERDPITDMCTIQYCTGTPCDDSKIQSQTKEVENIAKEINNIIKEPKPTDPSQNEKTGLETIITDIVPNILQDLQNRVRKTMHWCVTEQITQSETGNSELFDCDSAKLQIGPDGKTIQYCVDKTKTENAFFNDCLNQCYLTSGVTGTGLNTIYLYKKCLQECLVKKSQEAPADPRKTEFKDQLNFYCCNY